MRRSVICACVCSLVLVGCTGGGAATVTAAATQTPTPTPSATPTPSPTVPLLLTKAEAAGTYLKIVKPSNDLIAAISKLSTSRTFKRQRSLAGQIAGADRILDEQLLAVPWPANVTSLIQQLSTEVAGEIVCYVDLSHAKTWASFLAVDNSSECVPSDPSARVAESIRIRLGLPNVPV